MDQLQQIVRVIDDAIGPKVLGTYLHGSAVHGGLKPASDVDVLAVTRSPMDDHERRVLVDGLFLISGSRVAARPIELSVVVQSEVRPWRYPPVRDFLYGEWLRAEIEANGPPQPQPTPDLALIIAMTLAGDRSLQGPPPDQLLDPPPPADLARSSLAGIPSLLDDLAGDTRNVVLTFARIWFTLATGEVGSKDAAADWALTQLAPEHRAVLAYARRLYLTTPYDDETWSDELRAKVGPHVDAVLAEIRELADADR